MKRKLVILVLALGLTLLLIGCGASGGGSGGTVLGRSGLYIHAASDEEAFEQPAEDGEYTVVPDEIVPLSSLPADSDEGWILVRYAEGEDGDPSLLWYRIWTEDGRWSDVSVPYDGTDWHPEIP